MTRIRRINVSQVEGDSANNTDTNEIRPFGETAFYLDQNQSPNKLTLMMFDGLRTHLKSKVLAPGRLYGSDADSGDGNNYDTIKLIPDAQLFSNGSDQYIVVDPTLGAPGHIHIRAGGTQDASGADLYLGGEQTFVRVSDTTDDVVIRTGLSAAIENVNVQTVDELIPPGGVWRLFINDITYPTLGNTVQIGETVTTSWGTPVTATIVDIQQDSGNWQIHVDQDITVGFNAFNTVTFNRGSKTWTFATDGLLTLPSGNISIGSLFGTDAILANTGTAFGIISQGSGTSILQWIDDVNDSTAIAGIAVNSMYSNTGSVQIFTGNVGPTPQYAWTFGTDGVITLPNTMTIDGSGTGGEDVRIGGTSTWISIDNGGAPPGFYIRTDAGVADHQWLFGPDGVITLPGSGSVDGSDYDVEIIAGNDGSSTYGHVTLKTNGPNGVNEFYMNSLGELNLPRGGVIQETDVTNELWGTTTTSLTLVPAGAANSTQRLEIYSTGGGEGDHIHITSGDQNVTDLYLGNDTQYFAVGAMGENEIRARRGANSPSPGTSAGSGSPVWIYAGNAGDNGGSTADGAPGGDVFLQAGIASDGLGGEIILASGNGPTGHGSIKLSTNGGSSHLEFNNSGTLTFPSGGGIIFDSSATSTITGVSEVIFADGTTQTSAWLSGTVSSVQTSSLSSFIPETGTFTNTNQLTVSHQAHAADVGFTFTIDYQSPLDETKGVTVGAINTPLILSTGSVKVRANLSTSTEWTFGTDGGLTFPSGGNITFDSSATSTIAGLTNIVFADGTTQTTAFNEIGLSASLQGSGLSTGSVGFRIIPQNSQSANYVLEAADSGKHIFHPSTDTTNRTFTIPANSSVPWPIGTSLTFINQNNAGTITISITSDVMRLAGTGTTGDRILAANGIATAIKVTATEWIISGTGLS